MNNLRFVFRNGRKILQVLESDEVELTPEHGEAEFISVRRRWVDVPCVDESDNLYESETTPGKIVIVKDK